MRLARTLLGAVVLLLLFGARAVAAQVGVTTDILTGTVSDTAGRPLQGVTVEAISLETGVQRAGQTDGRGRYRILFPDGGGRYQLFFRMIGMTPARRQAIRQGDDDRLVTDVRLAAQPVELDELVATGRRITPDFRPAPGSTETNQTPDRLARLPLDAGDLTAIASLAAGVVTTGGTDSTSAGFSVAGQRPSANATTLDGMTFGASSIPQDAVRSTRVVTNTFDVSRGQFSGGLVASTTRSGTRVFQMTVNGNLRDPALSVSPDSLTTQPQAQQQVSFGLGGPLITNKLFGFASGQVRHRGNDLITLLTLADGGAERYGIAEDSLARYQGALNTLGIPLTTGGVPDNRSGTDLSGITRLDLLLGEAHTLTFRGDYRHSSDAPTRLAPLSPPASGGETSNTGGGAMLQLSSRLGSSFLNEAKVYLSGTSNEGSPYLSLPTGRVQLSSELSDGTISSSVLTFGGNNGFPQKGKSTAFEATNELSWLSGNSAHRIKMGAFYTTQRTTQEVASNRLGTFTFNSLADLEAGRAALFTRILGADERTGRSSTAALYVGDTWRWSQNLQLTFGARAEHSWFGDAPAYNRAVDSVFGLRTDKLPVETHVSPRVGFSYMVFAPDGPPSWFFRGGFGEFRSPIPGQLAVAAQAASGTSNGQIQLYCAGPDAPVVDWTAMAADPANIPTACVNGAPGVPLTGTPSITTFQKDYEAPRVWRGSLGVTRRSGLLTYGLDLSAGFGVAQSGFLDRNVGGSQFTLAEEGNREVYAPAGSIDQLTGTTPLSASRIDPSFGQVFMAMSDFTTRSVQAVFTVGGIVGNGITINTSYTLSRSTDQSSSGGFGGGGGFASQTAGRVLNADGRSVSDFDRRHQFLATVTLPIHKGFEITAIGRATSGAPYTPSVSGDINADGSRNDRAFIFDPATASDPALASAMDALLKNASSRVRDCLEGQLGQIAKRNSCRGPWQPSFDLQLNWKPSGWGFNQRLTISLLTSNLLAGLDQLFHDDDDLRGWGTFTRPDPTLLTVTGFDAANQRFTYEVNQRFGDIRGTQTLRQPFQLGLQFRLALGGQGGFFGGGPGGPGGGGFGGPGGPGGPGGFGGPPPGAAGQGGQPGAAGAAGANPGQAAQTEGFGQRIARAIADPVQPIVDLNIQLKLTDDQLARLKAISDSFVVERDSLGAAMQKEIEGMGRDPDRAVMFTAMRRRFEDGRALQQATLDKAKAVLTEAQWNQLPAEAKVPPRFGPGRGGPGGPGAGGPPRN